MGRKCNCAINFWKKKYSRKYLKVGEASPVLRTAAGLDPVPGRLAAAHYICRPRHQLVFGTRVIFTVFLLADQRCQIILFLIHSSFCTHDSALDLVFAF